MGEGVIYHRGLKSSGRWAAMAFDEQMANIASEVFRALTLPENGMEREANTAFERCLELIDMTRACLSGPRLRELSRVREVLCDYFLGIHAYGATKDQLLDYFTAFAIAFRYRRHRGQ